MRILNLYSGLGGNRKLWEGVEVTAVEKDQEIANLYQKMYPDDTVIIDDAHEYLLKNVNNFDFIWSSPPCQSHTKMIRSGNNRKNRYPDLRLYEEILFLEYNFKGLWVVENVEPYYKPLIQHQVIGRHLFWSNFWISPIDEPKIDNFINQTTVEGSEKLKDWLGIHYEGNIYYEDNHCPAQVLRNCVHPNIGLHVLKESAIKTDLFQ